MQEGQVVTKPRRPRKQPDKRQELGEKRQRICQDEIALHLRYKKEQQMIDYRRQQLKEDEQQEREEIQRMQEYRRNTPSQDWRQVLGNLRQKLLSGGFVNHEDDQRLHINRQ